MRHSSISVDVIMTFVIMVVFDFTRVLLSVDCDDDLRDGSFSVEILRQVFVLEREPRRLPRRITCIGRGCQFELLGFPLMRQVDCDLRRIDGNGLLRVAVQNVDCDLPSVRMDNFRVILFVSQLNEVAVVRSLSGMGVIMVVVSGCSPCTRSCRRMPGPFVSPQPARINVASAADANAVALEALKRCDDIFDSCSFCGGGK